jgi:hypothetical protein
MYQINNNAVRAFMFRNRSQLETKLVFGLLVTEFKTIAVQQDE